MIEKDIKDLNVGKTIVHNLSNFLYLGFQIIILFMAINVINKTTDEITLVLGLLIIVFLFLRYVRFKISTVYNSKKGGLIIFN